MLMLAKRARTLIARIALVATGMAPADIANVSPWFYLAESQAAFAETPATPSVTPSKSQPILLAVSLIWTGEHLEAHNLKAIAEFRKAFTGVNLVHFLSPAYFLKPDAKAEEIKAKIAAVMRPGDEIGLYLSSWRSLAEAAHVDPRRTPSFWGDWASAAPCGVDCGQDVPLTAFRPAEIQSLIARSKQILVEQGYGTPRAFMVSGWLPSQDVLDAAAAEGLAYDFSAVSPSVLAKRLGSYPLHRWLTERWTGRSAVTEPSVVTTPGRSIVELGNSAATVDYLTAEEITDLFKNFAREHETSPEKTLVFHVGLHQETAWQYLPRMSLALQKILALCQDQNIAIKPLELVPPPARPSAAPELETLSH